MAKVVMVEQVTLDGVMQAPGRADEDTRDGFAHGGWANPRNDEVMTAKTAERMTDDRAFLLGRRTYEQFYAFWPTQTGNPFAEALTDTRKYVASRTLAEPLPWSNSVLLEGDAADAVAKLRGQVSGSLTIFGSGELVRSLLAAELIDEYLLMIHPLVLGAGLRLFSDGDEAQLQLIDNVTTSTGVLIATYEPVGATAA